MLYKDFVNDRYLVDHFYEICPNSIKDKYTNTTKTDLAVRCYNLINPNDEILFIDPIYYDKVVTIDKSDNAHEPILTDAQNILIRSTVEPNPILIIVSNNAVTPCIGSEPELVSGGRWVSPRPENRLKKITIDGVKVVCCGKDPAFCIGNYGSEDYPEIELVNGGELVTTDTGRKIIYPPIPTSGSTKHTTYLGYSCNGDYSIEQKDIGMDKLNAPHNLHPKLYTKIKNYEDKFNIIMLTYFMSATSRELSYLSEDSIYYGAAMIILGFEPNTESEFLNTISVSCIDLMDTCIKLFCKKYNIKKENIKDFFKTKFGSTLAEIEKLSPAELHAFDTITSPWEIGNTKEERIYNWLNSND